MTDFIHSELKTVMLIKLGLESPDTCHFEACLILDLSSDTHLICSLRSEFSISPCITYFTV